LSDTNVGTIGAAGQVPGSAYDTVRRQKTILGHPAGLFVLFFTEMWERVSYYGMRALLVLYMVDYLIKNVQAGTAHVFGFFALQRGIESMFGPMGIQPLASQIYGLYTAFVYFTPFFGGMLADRVLGQRKTVVVGAVLMAIGHFMMAVESMFLLALFFLILGNGCFKPNLTTQVGSLYPPGDPRLDRAYTIYYMGVNLGAFLAPLICGTLGQVYGWHYGFGAAGVGMVFGLCLYLWGQRFLADDQLKRAKDTHLEKVPLTSKEWKAILGLVALCILNIVFWGVYEQQGNTIQLFADRNADWHIFGWQMPSTWFQAVNPLFIFVLTPLLNMFWGWQSMRGKEPMSVTKMGLGCLFLGVSFLPLMYIATGLGDTQRIHFMWLVGSTLIYTVGEMYLSPIGLSLVSKVAPTRLVSMLMGMWFMANFFGNYLAGYLGTYYEKMSKESFFMMLTVLGVAAGVSIFALRNPLKNAVGHKA
jgi:POT family proton-dependent oligopeptide transporter